MLTVKSPAFAQLGPAILNANQNLLDWITISSGLGIEYSLMNTTACSLGREDQAKKKPTSYMCLLVFRRESATELRRS